MTIYRTFVCMSLLILAQLVSSCGKPNLDNFNTSDKEKLSESVWLYRTGGKNVTLGDKEGMGIVYGNVVRVCYELRGKDYLIVEFEPFTNGSTSQLEYARVDLASGKVEAISHIDDSRKKLLKNVDRFRP